MGVSILASWRHPNVVVMAPALTEAGQSQTFNNASLKKLFGNVELPLDLEPGDNNILKLTESGLSRLTNGLSENLKDKIGLVHYKTKGVPQEILSLSADKDSGTPTEQQASDKPSMQRGAPMGDNSDNMGMLKSNTKNSISEQTDICATQKINTINQTVENGNLIKDRNVSADMDQLLKNISAVISLSDLNPTDFTPPNVDELLQVIKSMETTCESGEAPSDTPESEAIFPLSGTDLASFERELLDDVEMMTNFVVDHIPESGLDLKESLTKEKLDEASKRLFDKTRKCERLQRRLKKWQTRTVGKHTSEEMTGLLERANSLVKYTCDNRTDITKDKRLKGVSDTMLSSFVKRLTTSAHNQARGFIKHRSNYKYFGSGTSDDVEQPNSTNGSILPKFSTEEAEEVQTVSEQLHNQLYNLQCQLDSDATASSSGGESCDELQNYNNSHQSHLSISKRTFWRYCRDRGGIASRWSWLQAKISDLEYRLRLYTEYQKQTRVSKGTVSLGEQQTTPVSVNGYHGTLPGGVTINLKPAGEEVLNGTISSLQSNNCDVSSMSASRTRPFVNSAFRKRKLHRTSGLHLVSKKAARSSTMTCSCGTDPLTRLSCVLCTGRQDATLPVERPDLMSVPERIALQDHCYHSVLSFPKDVLQPVHLDSIMQLHDWQMRVNRYNVKVNKYNTSKENEPRLDRRPRLKKKMKMSGHKNLRNIRKNTAAALSAKLKKKLTANQRKRRDLKTGERLPLLRIRSKPRKISSGYDDGSDEEDQELYVETVPVDRDSPQHSPRDRKSGEESKSDKDYPATAVTTTRRRNMKDDDSYNIDNIVIPYSMAASTRVQKLQYKEILTPKWRIVDLGAEAEAEKDEGEVEDISDEAFVERHARCEETEKKKFMSYIKLPLSVRTRTNRRTDSRAESSGANTPDPMSPGNLEHVEGSPMTTPPATPLSLTTDEQCQLLNSRRRTVSTSAPKLLKDRTERDREERCATPDSYIEVAPYDVRTYPLTDEEYEKMLKEMPHGHSQIMPFPILSKKLARDFDFLRNPGSPSTSSTVSAVEDDPNDPEWTIGVDNKDKDEADLRGRHKR